jgi:hypothetical protein
MRSASHSASVTLVFFQLAAQSALVKGFSPQSIRVGRKETSAAPYYIRNQAEIDRLLERVARGRRQIRRRHPHARLPDVFAFAHRHTQRV